MLCRNPLSLSFRKALERRIVAFIHLGPDCLYPMPSLQSGFSVLATSFRSLDGQTFVDLILDTVAVAESFIEEAAGVTFV